MSKLKEVEDTANKIKEEGEVEARNVRLARDINEIQKLFNVATSDRFPVRLKTGKTDDGRFHFVIVPCNYDDVPTVDIDITLGVHSTLGHNLGDEALLVIETYRANHKPGDPKYEASLFVLGKDYVKKPVSNARLEPVQSSNLHFDDEYRSIGLALDLVQKTVQDLFAIKS